MSQASRNQRRLAKQHRDVMVGYCRPDQVDGRFNDWAWHLLLHDRDADNRIRGALALASGPRIPQARTELVRNFLAMPGTDTLPRPEWLWMIDADMHGPADALDGLLDAAEIAIERVGHRSVVVGALCFAGGKSTVYPTIYGIRENEDGVYVADTMLEYPEDTLLQVSGTGAACTLINRSVLETLTALVPGPFPCYQDLVIGGNDWGEDLVFCLRANMLGAAVFVHTGIKIGHRKTVTLDEDKFREFVAKGKAAGKLSETMTVDEFTQACGAKL